MVKKKTEELDSRYSILDRAKQKRFYLKEDLKLTEIELNCLKKESKKITNQLLTHYHNLLNEGIDTRFIFIN